MEWFFSLLRTLSVLSVVLAGIWMLAPRGSMEKSFRFSLGIFVLGAIMTAIFQPINISFPNIENTEPVYYKSSQCIAKVDTEYIVRKLLEKESIFCKKITLIEDNSADGRIHITKAAVELYNEDDSKRAADILMRETGIEMVGGTYENDYRKN